MAKSKVNKSKWIRALLEANPSVSVSEAQAAAKAEGLEITSSLFYANKQRMKKKTKTAAKPAGGPSLGNVPLTALRDVRVLAEKMGGYESLIEVAKAMK